MLAQVSVDTLEHLASLSVGYLLNQPLELSLALSFRITQLLFLAGAADLLVDGWLRMNGTPKAPAKQRFIESVVSDLLLLHTVRILRWKFRLLE